MKMQWTLKYRHQASKFNTPTQSVTYALVYTDSVTNTKSVIYLPGYGAMATTGTVQSAKTADSGVMLYVALLTVSALLGTALAIDKRKAIAK